MLLFFYAAQSQNFHQPTFQNLEADHFGVQAITGALKNKKTGFMWLGTKGGLGIYNGFKTKIFAHTKDINSPLSNSIMEMYEDSKGILWFGYFDKPALTSFDLEKNIFTHYEYDSTKVNSFPNEVVSRFLEDSKGNLLVSTWGGGIVMFDKDRKKMELLNDKWFPDNTKKLKSLAVRAMLELEKGKILVSYFHEQPGGHPGVLDLDKKTVTPFNIDDYKGKLSDVAFEEVRHILTICHFFYKDPYEKLWVGTYSGLVCIDLKNKWCKRVSGRAFNEDIVQNLDNAINYTVDEKGLLWVATSSGIMIVDPLTTKAYYHKTNLNCSNCVADNSIGNFTKDNDGNIWVTNGSRGISIYTPFKQEIKLKPWPDLKVDFSNASAQRVPINQILIRNNKTALLSNLNGITVYNYEKDSIVELIKTFTGNTKAIGNWQNIFHFRLVKNKLYFCSNGNEPSNTNPSIYDIRTKSGIHINDTLYLYGILFMTDTVNTTSYSLGYRYNYLFEWKERSFKVFNSFSDKKYPDPHMSYMLKNNKWFLTSGSSGFLLFDPNTKQTIKYGNDETCDIRLNDTTLLTYFYNEKSTVWMGSIYGILSLDIQTGEVKKWNKEIGLDKNPVYGIVEDKNGNIWFTTHKEFCQYNFKEHKLIKYNKSLAIPSYGFDHRRELRAMATDGENVFFPSVRGLLHFNINKIKLPNNPLSLSISDIYINDSLLPSSARELILAGNYDLSYSQNNLLFELNTNQVFTPTSTKFKYKLIGVNENWVDNENSNKIKLYNLNPGTYTLEVSGTNCYGVTSANLPIVFTIKKPFWLSWWFIGASIGILILMVIFIIKQREKDLQKKQAELEKIVDERTKELSHQKELIEEKQKEIVDSIKYAQRIQKALLASKNLLDSHLEDYFIFFNPKDLVSGDFYWATEINGKFYFIVADSTGHGVPGAFMSLLNISYLNEAINERRIEKPGDVLNYVRQRLISSLAEDGSSDGGKDGMDCSLLCFDFTNNNLYYSCAHNPLVVIRNGQLLELAADRMPVGKSPKENLPFSNKEFTLEKNDVIYIFTDGYADQFGGEGGKKLKYKNLKNYLLNYSLEKIPDQEKILSDKFNSWKGNLEQIDDVTVVGIRI